MKAFLAKMLDDSTVAIIRIINSQGGSLFPRHFGELLQDRRYIVNRDFACLEVIPVLSREWMVVNAGSGFCPFRPPFVSFLAVIALIRMTGFPVLADCSASSHLALFDFMSGLVRLERRPAGSLDLALLEVRHERCLRRLAPARPGMIACGFSLIRRCLPLSSTFVRRCHLRTFFLPSLSHLLLHLQVSFHGDHSVVATRRGRPLTNSRRISSDGLASAWQGISEG
mmetsp:Transcript_45024/g.141752  ORF Transcript_45024/g.141752 Transcript_45024/m.141752 type:complete len:226 (+) Transcript_45024:568-1245(+)